MLHPEGWYSLPTVTELSSKMHESVLLRNLSVSGALDKVTRFIIVDSIKCYCEDMGNGLRNHCGGTKTHTICCSTRVRSLQVSEHLFEGSSVASGICHVTSSGLDQNDLIVLRIEFHYRANICGFMITLSFTGQEALKLEHSRNSTWYVSSGIELFGCLTNKAIIERIIMAIRGFSNIS